MSATPTVLSIDQVVANPSELIDALTYGSYAANRDYGMSPESLASLLAVDKDAYEARYRRDLAEGRVKLSLPPDHHEPIEKVCAQCMQRHCICRFLDQ